MNRFQKMIFLVLFNYLFACAAFAVCEQKQKYKVGLLVMATGKYTVFLENLLKSADAYFLPEHEVTYFVFTDGQVPDNNHVVKIYQKRLGWPHDTLMRFQVYCSASNALQQMDYLFACDADMLFVDTVGDEILGDRVATRHPGFVGERLEDYEKNPLSTAYIAPGEGKYYYAGGFYGGTSKEFLKIAQTCLDNIFLDLQRDYIAVWHDESHLNRYFVDNPPTVVLSPSYCYPDVWDLPYPKKLLAITKDLKEFQVK